MQLVVQGGVGCFAVYVLWQGQKLNARVQREAAEHAAKMADDYAARLRETTAAFTDGLSRMDSWVSRSLRAAHAIAKRRGRTPRAGVRRR